jgi:hypothetical protein
MGDTANGKPCPAAANLRVRHELARLVQHADGGAVPERLLEQLGARAVGEAVLRHHADHVGVLQAKPRVRPLVGLEHLGVAHELLEARPLPG